MSNRPDAEVCDTCLLPKTICICHPTPEYDPLVRRAELLDALNRKTDDELQEMINEAINEAIKAGTINPVNPFSDGHGDTGPTPTA